jgi:hypothetical protein
MGRPELCHSRTQILRRIYLRPQMTASSGITETTEAENEAKESQFFPKHHFAKKPKVGLG